jgi:hypothetical protein
MSSSVVLIYIFVIATMILIDQYIHVYISKTPLYKSILDTELLNTATNIGTTQVLHNTFP